MTLSRFLYLTLSFLILILLIGILFFNTKSYAKEGLKKIFFNDEEVFVNINTFPEDNFLIKTRPEYIGPIPILESNVLIIPKPINIGIKPISMLLHDKSALNNFYIPIIEKKPFDKRVIRKSSNIEDLANKHNQKKIERLDLNSFIDNKVQVSFTQNETKNNLNKKGSMEKLQKKTKKQFEAKQEDKRQEDKKQEEFLTQNSDNAFEKSIEKSLNNDEAENLEDITQQDNQEKIITNLSDDTTVGDELVNDTTDISDSKDILENIDNKTNMEEDKNKPILGSRFKSFVQPYRISEKEFQTKFNENNLTIQYPTLRELENASNKITFDDELEVEDINLTNLNIFKSLENKSLYSSILATTVQDSNANFTKKTIDHKSKEDWMIQAYQNQNLEKYIFPNQDKHGIAIFSRDSYLWIVIDNHYHANISGIQNSKYIEKIYQVEHPTHTIIIAQMKTENYKIYDYDVNNYLVLEIMDTETFEESRAISYNLTKFPYRLSGPFMNIVDIIGNTSYPIIITDPIVGDRVTILPDVQKNQYINKGLESVDFGLCSSIRGVPIAIHSDDMQIVHKIDKIQLFSPNIGQEWRGSSVNFEELPVYSTIEEDQKEELDNRKIILPFPDFIFDDSMLEKKLQEFVELARNSENIEELRGRYFDITKINFANQRYREAIAPLEYIAFRKRNPYDNKELSQIQKIAQITSPEIKLLSMISYLFSNQISNALALYKLIDENEYPIQFRNEVRMWKDYVLSLDPYKSHETSNIYKQFMQKYLEHIQYYPNILQRELAMRSIENALKDKNNEKATKILKIIEQKIPLTKAKLIHPRINDNSVQYYKARIVIEEKGITPEIETLLNDMSTQYDDQMNRVRSSMLLVKTLRENGKMSLEDAISRLELLQFSWKGDRIEKDLLNMLGDLKIENNEIIEGMQIFQRIINNFSTDFNSLNTYKKMSTIFSDMLNEDSQMDDISLISLFFGFPEFIPSGHIGDKIVEKVLILLDDLDLVSRAINILHHRIKFRLEGQSKKAAILQLAQLYIDNGQIDLGLELLTKYKDILSKEKNSTYFNEMHFLFGKAYYKLEDYKQALSSIKAIDIYKARELKLLTLWNLSEYSKIVNMSDYFLNIYQNSIQSENSTLPRGYLINMIKIAISARSEGNNNVISKIQNILNLSTIRDEDRDIKMNLDFILRNVNKLDNMNATDIDLNIIQEEVDNILNIIDEYDSKMN